MLLANKWTGSKENLKINDLVFTFVEGFNESKIGSLTHLFVDNINVFDFDGVLTNNMVYLDQNVKPVTYSGVKTGFIVLTRYLVTYWVDKNARYNAMCSGVVENGQPDDFLREVNKRIPAGRMANTDEYQGTLLWMLSDASSYLNGPFIAVEGGRAAW